jgi:hypothetical protein
MTPPTPNRIVEAPARLVQGPLISQPAAAARLAHILVHAAEDLWDAATLSEPSQMYEDARRAASRVLAACPLE